MGDGEKQLDTNPEIADSIMFRRNYGERKR
jgi:hypothetical protein